MIRVAAIDDHPLMLKAITEELMKQSDMQLVGTADHGSKLFDLVREKSPHVVILDLGMARGVFEPISAVRSLLKTHPEVRILILTGDDNQSYMRELIAAGAMGYVLKSDDLSMALPQAVRTVYGGERFYSTTVLKTLFPTDTTQLLSNREIEILRLVAQGLQNTAIAEAQGLSEKRIRNILSDIYAKMEILEADGEINHRVALVNKARKMGLLLDK